MINILHRFIRVVIRKAKIPNYAVQLINCASADSYEASRKKNQGSEVVILYLSYIFGSSGGSNRRLLNNNAYGFII